MTPSRNFVSKSATFGLRSRIFLKRPHWERQHPQMFYQRITIFCFSLYNNKFYLPVSILNRNSSSSYNKPKNNAPSMNYECQFFFEFNLSWINKESFRVSSYQIAIFKSLEFHILILTPRFGLIQNDLQ